MSAYIRNLMVTRVEGRLEMKRINNKGARTDFGGDRKERDEIGRRYVLRTFNKKGAEKGEDGGRKVMMMELEQ